MQPKIRILLFSSLFPSASRPGFGTFVATRLQQLAATGEIEVRVVAPVPWFPCRHPIFGSWARYAATPRHETWEGMSVEHPRYFLPPKIGMSLAPLLMAVFCLPKVWRIHKEFGVDIIDAHFYYPDGAAAAIIARFLGLPLVVTARGSDLNVVGNYFIPRRFIRWTARMASCSIGVSRELLEKLRALGAHPARTRVLRNGVDLQRFRPVEIEATKARLGLEEGRWLVSVGWLIDRKGHDIAIKALPHLQGFKLAIVGEGERLQSLRQLAEALGVADRVRFVGAVRQENLPDWYGMAEVLLLCSSYEGWANVLLEAMACGTPVVATAVGGTPEVVLNPVAGRLMAERTPEALVASLRELLADYPDRTAVRAYAGQFGWQETSLGQLSVFRQCLSD